MQSVEQILRSSEFSGWLHDRVRQYRRAKTAVEAAIDSQQSESQPIIQGNQALVLRYQHQGVDLALKCCHGNRLQQRLQYWSLQREYRAYQYLQGLTGIPRCFGLQAVEWRGRAPVQLMVLEFITGTAYRQASFADRERFFNRFDCLLDQVHQRGVSHGDLKRKENILVDSDEQPWLLDFGISICYKNGWHPIKNRLYRYQCKLDINAMLKHKYYGNYANITGPDRQRLNYSLLERGWRVSRKLLGIR